jgi:hypothetical protein
MTTTKTPTAAQLKLNHERTAKAVERLNDKAWAGIRYEAILEEGKPGVISYSTRPYNARYDAPYTEVLRYETQVDQTIGHPVNYTNKYSGSNSGTMCQGIDRAIERRSHRRDALRAAENKADKLREELAAAEANVARIKAELGE